MELESLFSSTRWEILDSLSKEALSPMELADRMNTTSANISQQLRLLELGGLVKSEKTSNVDKGKPRVVYSIAGDNAFLILASQKYVNKKMMVLDNYHKYSMKVWFLEDTDVHLDLIQLYFMVKDRLLDIVMIGVNEQKSAEAYVVAATQKYLDSLKKEITGLKKVRVNVVLEEDLKKSAKDIFVLYNKKMGGSE